MTDCESSSQNIGEGVLETVLMIFTVVESYPQVCGSATAVARDQEEESFVKGQLLL